MEDEIKELKKRNSELEEELKTVATTSAVVDPEEAQRTEALQAEVDRVREEAEALRNELSAALTDAAEATKLAEGLQASCDESVQSLSEKEKEVESLQREMRVAEERAQGELDASMETKRQEMNLLEERAESAEQSAEEMRALVEDLTQAGQVRYIGASLRNI